MAKVYIVQGSCGEYSDRNEWIVVASMSKEKADSITASLNELMSYQNAYKRKKFTEFEQVYKQIHPYPPVPERNYSTPEYLELKAISKKNVGDDVRAIWKRLDAEEQARIARNKIAEQEYSRLMREWDLRFGIAQKEYDTQYSIPEHLQAVSAMETSDNGYDGTTYVCFGVELV